MKIILEEMIDNIGWRRGNYKSPSSQRMPSGEEAREVQQELYALKMSRRRHENVVKFFTSETDDKSLYT